MVEARLKTVNIFHFLQTCHRSNLGLLAVKTTTELQEMRLMHRMLTAVMLQLEMQWTAIWKSWPGYRSPMRCELHSIEIIKSYQSEMLISFPSPTILHLCCMAFIPLKALRAVVQQILACTPCYGPSPPDGKRSGKLRIRLLLC